MAVPRPLCQSGDDEFQHQKAFAGVCAIHATTNTPDSTADTTSAGIAANSTISHY